MNAWYIISLIIIGLGILILIGLILASIFPILKTVKNINLIGKRMQERQIDPLQAQLTQLLATANRIKQDVEMKKTEITEVVNQVKSVGKNVQALSISSRRQTKQIVEKVKKDPTMQAQTNEWTNNVVSFLKRNA